MTNQQATYRRVLRRETHAPRTIPAVVVASAGLLILVAIVVGAVGWLIDPLFRQGVTASYAAVAQIASTRPVLIAVGAAAVLIAGVLLGLALLPGRRARRARTTDRAALLVDDGVIADSVAEAAARRTGVARSQVSVTIGRRVATVRITPTSGIPVDRSAAESAAADTLSGIGFTATPRIVVASEGVIA